MFQQNLFWLVAIWFLSVVPSVEAQQTKAVPKIGYLSASTRTSHAQSYHAFQQGLRELGYMEGRNIAVEARFAEGRPIDFRNLSRS